MFRISLLIIAFLTAIFNTSYAGIYIEEQITTTIPGTSFSGIKKTYISGTKALIIDPTLPSKQIFDFKQEKVYLVNEKKRTLATSELNAYTAPVNESIYQDFVSLSDQDFYCKESGGKKKIGNYECFELVVYIPRIASFTRLWLTRDIEPELTSHFRFLTDSLDVLHKKIISLRGETSAYVIESSTSVVRPDEPEKYLKTQLIKIGTQDIPEDMFALPVDYTMVR